MFKHTSQSKNLKTQSHKPQPNLLDQVLRWLVQYAPHSTHERIELKFREEQSRWQQMSLCEGHFSTYPTVTLHPTLHCILWYLTYLFVHHTNDDAHCQRHKWHASGNWSFSSIQMQQYSVAKSAELILNIFSRNPDPDLYPTSRQLFARVGFGVVVLTRKAALAKHSEF